MYHVSRSSYDAALGAFDSVSQGTYTRVCELAKGGMGTVDLAVRSEGTFRRLYAIKRLRESYREDPEFRAMFLDEARIAGFIRHPHVVSVLDVGEDAQGPFLVLDYVDGISAADLVKRVAERGLVMPMSVALRIAIDAAEGLHAAHELHDPETRQPLNLVHRDVSPQNILLGFDGSARVTDFGVAKALGRVTRTSTGVLKGKMGYMAPEVLRFEEPDLRSDLFSLGVVLIELLIGRRLYRNTEGMDGARRVLNEPPPDLGELREDAPPELVELMFQMLAKSRDHRPQSARDVARRLESVLADVHAEGAPELSDYIAELFEDRREESAERVRLAHAAAEERTSPRARPRALVGVLAAVVIVCAIVLGVALTRDEPPQPSTPEENLPDPVMELGPLTIENVPVEADPADETAETDPPAPEPRMRARMRETTQSSDTPMWGWQ